MLGWMLHELLMMVSLVTKHTSPAIYDPMVARPLVSTSSSQAHRMHQKQSELMVWHPVCVKEYSLLAQMTQR